MQMPDLQAAPEGGPRMSATNQPYSYLALQAAEEATAHAGEAVRIALDAAHNRKALGLDASVHAGAYRAELLREVATWIYCADIPGDRREIADTFLREFGANGATDGE